MRKLFLLTLIIAQGAFGQKKFNIEEFYPIDVMHSYVSFSVVYMGYAKVQGNFSDFNGTFRYNPDDVNNTSISFSIDVASIDTNLEWRDNDLKSNRWFDAENYPKITFESTSVSKNANGLLVKGNLTARDVTKEVELQLAPASGVLTDIRGDAQVIFSGSYTFDRTEYGIAGERWSAVKEGIAGVAKEVTVDFSMLGKQIRKANYSNWVRNEERPPGRLYAAYKRGGTKECFAEFEKLKEEIEVNTAALNTVGYMLIKEEKYKDAIAVMEKNRDEFPEDGNVYDSLGEAYAFAGDLKKAKTNYQLSIEKDPDNLNAKEVLRHFK